jgi:hypothetical protein
MERKDSIVSKISIRLIDNLHFHDTLSDTS